MVYDSIYREFKKQAELLSAVKSHHGGYHGVVTVRGLRGILGCCPCSGFDPSAGSPAPLPPALFCVCVCLKICSTAHL